MLSPYIVSIPIYPSNILFPPYISLSMNPKNLALPCLLVYCQPSIRFCNVNIGEQDVFAVAAMEKMKTPNKIKTPRPLRTTTRSEERRCT